MQSTETEELRYVEPVLGDLEVDGCTPPITDIVVTATESIGTLINGQNQPQTTQASPPIRALVLPTFNAHKFKVLFPLLHSRTVYSIAAAMKTLHCPKIAWQGPHAGELTVGVTPLRITAFAMRTQTEVLATRGPNHTPTWVGIDAIDLDTPQGAVRDLRWHTDVPGAVAGKVEISTEPFPVGPAAQQQQVPLLATWTVPLAQQGWGVVSGVDFAAPFQPPACDPQQYPNGCPTTITPLGALHLQAQAGAPLYARVVPIDAAGTRLGDNVAFGISSTVKVAHTGLPLETIPPPPPPPPAPPLQFDFIYYFPPFPEYARGYNQGCYRVNTAHTVPSGTLAEWSTDYWGSRLLSTGKYAPGGTIPVGDLWCFSESSGGILSDIVDSISGLVDAVGDLVNEISKLYDQIKHAVVDAVASALTDLHVFDCDDTCKLALMAGLDAALASVGLPPSLPNFDELADRGLDYLEDVAAEESGVPEDLIHEARTVAGQAIAEMKAHHAFPPAPWLTPDDGFRPSQLRMQVHKNPASTDPIPGDLRFASGTTFHGTDLFLPTQKMADGSPASFTAELLPDFSAIPPPPDECSWGVCFPLSDGEKQLYYEDKWFQLVADESCEGITATGYGVGRFGAPDSALVFLPGPGIQMQWLLTPSAYLDGPEPFKYTCP